MDYVKARQPVNIIRDHFRLTIQQTEDVLAYIEQHRDEVEAEYQRIVKQAEENRQYWQQRNAQRFEELAIRPRKAEHRAIWDKLDALRKHPA